MALHASNPLSLSANDPFFLALQQFQKANFYSVLEVVDHRLDFYHVLLRSRTLLRIGRADDAVECLEALKHHFNSASLSVDQDLELNVVTALSAIASRRFDLAGKVIREAKSRIFYEHSIDLETELHYAESLFSFATGDFDEAKRCANRSLSAADDFLSGDARPILSASYKEHHRAKSLQVLAVLCSNQARYHEQANLLRTALKGLARSRTPDVYTAALLKLNLSFYVRDLDSEIDVDLVEADEWPKDLNSLAAAIARSIGLFRAAQGDYPSSNDWLTRAGELTPSPAFELVLISDRSLLSRSRYDKVSSDSLLSAYDAAITSEWPPDARDRDALYLLAQELSYIESTKAKELMDVYHSGGIVNDPLILHDRRNLAELRFAEATINRNARESSVDQFFEAFEMWNGVGYRKYAAMAAVELAELTGKETFAAYARRESGLRPGSWLDLRVRRMKI